MKKQKTKYTHNSEWIELPGSEKKTLLMLLHYFNEGGSKDEALKLIKNKWVMKIYTLPHPQHPRYNSIKSIRSQYWSYIKKLINKYIIENE